MPGAHPSSSSSGSRNGLDEHWSAWFAPLTLTHEADGTTILRGGVTGQAELHGLLAMVRDIGATLIAVTPLHAAQDLEPPPPIPPEQG